MNENISPYTPLISYFRDNEGRLELDFESDPTDIIYSEHGLLDRSSMVRPTRDAEDTEQIQSLKVNKIHHSAYKSDIQMQSFYFRGIVIISLTL